MAELADIKVTMGLIEKITPNSSWWKILKEAFFHTQGDGVSSTKTAYLGGMGIVMCCSFMMVFTLCWVYWRWHVTDPVFAGTVATIVLALIGMASRSQNVKAKITGASTAGPTTTVTTDTGDVNVAG